MQLENYKILIQDDLLALEEYIEHIISRNLQNSKQELKDIIKYTTTSKGKRVRSIILLLFAKSLKNNSTSNSRFTDYIKLAALIELLHTATLLHDDVIDGSLYRRNKFTVNYKWNDLSSIVAGDWLLSIIFQILVDINNKDILKLFSSAFNNLVSGELLQLDCINHKITYDEYLQIITKKTAILFELATAIPAILSNTSNNLLTNVKNYGYHIGLSFQMSDDILDYLGDPNIRGKNALEDIQNGKITLPIIELLKIEPNYLENYHKNPNVLKLIDTLNATGALNSSINIAKAHCSIAIKNLEPINNSCYTEALAHIAESISDRLY